MKIDDDTIVANSADGPGAADVIPAETVEVTVSFVEFVGVVTPIEVGVLDPAVDNADVVLRSALVEVTEKEVSADDVRAAKPFAPKVVKGAVSEVVKAFAVVVVPVAFAVVGTLKVVAPVVA